MTDTPQRGIGVIASAWAEMNRRTMTRADIMDHCGVNYATASTITQDLASVGLARAVGSSVGGVTYQGCMVPAPTNRARQSTRLFRAFLDAIDAECGATTEAVMDRLCITRTKADYTMRQLRTAGAVHVSGWDRQSTVSGYAAVYSVGPGRDVKRPRALTCAEYNARAAAKMKAAKAARRGSSVFSWGAAA